MRTIPNMPGFIPSAHQEKFLDWIDNGAGNGMLVAVAGSGKTTTLVAAANVIPDDQSGYAVVFNKRNAEELKARFPAHFSCSTFHSLWMRACRDNLGRFQVDGNKMDGIVMELLPRLPARSWGAGNARSPRQSIRPEYRDYIAPLKRVVGYAQNIGIRLLVDDVPDTYRRIIETLEMDLDEEGVRENELIEFAQQAIAANADNLDRISYDDMLWLPLVHGWGIERRDWVFVDEAQDSNSVQRALVARMVKRGTGRVVFVGDPHQAIYAFRGATSGAMDVIARDFRTEELPLTVSFRCPKAVIAEAQKIVSHITSADSAIDGEVQYVDAAALDPELLREGTFVVCRTTAPLVQLALHLMARRVPCTVLGRDIGSGIIALIRRFRSTTLDGLAGDLDAWKEREVAKAESKLDDAKVAQVQDRYNTIMSFIERAPVGWSVEDLISEILPLFSENAVANGATLMTAHRSKGLEAQRVVIIRPDLMPMPWVRWNSPQMEQEKNLKYVAMTRAKHTLVIANGEEVQLRAPEQQAA